MLIVVDIGNTSIKLGFAKHNTLIETMSLPSDIGMHTADSLALQILTMLQHLEKSKTNINAFVVSSVVPALDLFFKEIAEKFFKTKAYIVGKDIHIPLENLYDNPKEVGADRLVAAYAARMLYTHSKSIISVDFGTATTFDCVENNSYLGGLICPGVLSSHLALSQKAAKLPRIALEVEENIPQVGRNTSISISHGFVFGFSAMTQGLLIELSKQLKEKPFVVATGGFAPNIAKHVENINTVESNLILIGLILLHNNI